MENVFKSGLHPDLDELLFTRTVGGYKLGRREKGMSRNYCSHMTVLFIMYIFIAAHGVRLGQ